MVLLGKEGWCNAMWKNIQAIGGKKAHKNESQNVAASLTAKSDGGIIHPQTGYLDAHGHYQIPTINEGVTESSGRGKFQLKIAQPSSDVTVTQRKSPWDETQWCSY